MCSFFSQFNLCPTLNIDLFVKIGENNHDSISDSYTKYLSLWICVLATSMNISFHKIGNPNNIPMFKSGLKSSIMSSFRISLWIVALLTRSFPGAYSTRVSEFITQLYKVNTLGRESTRQGVDEAEQVFTYIGSDRFSIHVKGMFAFGVFDVLHVIVP